MRVPCFIYCVIVFLSHISSYFHHLHVVSSNPNYATITLFPVTIGSLYCSKMSSGKIMNIEIWLVYQ